jgi:hypothetical protein
MLGRIASEEVAISASRNTLAHFLSPSIIIFLFFVLVQQLVGLITSPWQTML